VATLQFGSAEEAVGRQVRISVSQQQVGPPHVLLTVIGTAPDVHFQSLKEPIGATMYLLNTRADNTGAITVRYDPSVAGDFPRTLERVWQKLIPDYPPVISDQFLDKHWDAQYAGDAHQAQTLTVFAALAIVIACLGLFGLSSFTAELRTKEIGIGKVMTAKTRNIVRLLLLGFSKPIVVASVIAWPVAWYTMSQWLTQYHYRVDLGVVHFVLPAVGALVIAWATLAVHITRVSSASPMGALRYE
jgi:putative ABC transport system permease protein